MPLDLNNPGRPIRAGVILVDSVTEVLDVAQFDLFSGVTEEFGAPLLGTVFPEEAKQQFFDFEYHWVTQSGRPAKMTGGLMAQATDSFETCPPLDIVMMGAHAMGYTPSKEEIAFVRKSYEDCTAFFCVCGGMMVPMMAGALEGKTATAPRIMLDQLKKDAPGVNWVEKRWQHDGKMWTSGALLNGSEMMRAFAEETWTGDRKWVATLLDLGSYPSRDVDYKDGP